ncbi:hypothetical protein HDU88_004978 [Geranomyces variabilis]|nr:hypothetical protein HDU88_004978 [Geranomyces variabilis]
MFELVDHPNSGSPARAAADTRFQHDIVVYVVGILDNLGQLVQGMFGFAIGVVFSLAVAWRLALPLVAYMWVLMVSSQKFCPGLGPRSSQGAAKDASGIANEVFGAIRTIKVFGGSTL